MNADQALARAAELERVGRRAGGWLAWWYVVFGIATLCFAAGLAYAHSPVVLGLVILGWGATVLALVVYAATRRAALRNMGRTHGALIAWWTVAWAATVALGVSAGPGGYLAGGVLCLLVCLLGAARVRRQVRA
ncbi:MAG: hypothetical protein ACK5MT_08515 [Actinomycetales bacterium]